MMTAPAAPAKKLADKLVEDVTGVAPVAPKDKDVGKPLDIQFTATDGLKVDLAKMKGKVVLIDFRATWCGPCVAELPNVKKAYAKLHPKGFEIVGISLDSSEDKLKKFIKDREMPWPQYFDGQGWKNKISTRYGIRSIPAMWLVDKEGNLVDKNARRGLEGKVEKLLADKKSDLSWSCPVQNSRLSIVPDCGLSHFCPQGDPGGLFSMWENFILAVAESSGEKSASIWDSIIKQAPGLITQWGPKTALALILLFVFWLASRIVRKMIITAGEKGEIDYHVVRLMAMTARVGLLIAGIITSLGTLGVDVSALVAGLGLTGFALGFAVKDTISNILAGVLLLVYRPFALKDYLEVKGMKGLVQAIDLRYTTLNNGGQTILLPNSLLFTNPITIGKADTK